MHPSRAGTYTGLIEKIPYLKDLGITVVELMPVFQRDPHEKDYWGYVAALSIERRCAPYIAELKSAAKRSPACMASS